MYTNKVFHGIMGRLIYIDDQELNRDLITRQLERFGHHMDGAADGPTGLGLLEQHQYDLVLLDIEMPDMNGIDVLKAIRRQYSLLELPVIMITANNQDDSLITALSFGANDYLTKPLNVDVAAARIKTQLALAQYAALKDDFLRFASHDLKKPLMLIQDVVEVIKQDHSKTIDDAQFNDDINLVVDTCNNMQTVITGFLDQSKNDVFRESNKTLVDINRLVKETVKSNLHYAEQKQHGLTCKLADDLPSVDVDSFNIRQIIDNLIGNAIKFSPAGSSTSISTDIENSQLVVSVTDQGPGLSDDDSNKLFIKHAQLSNKPTGNETSTGVGLALCKELVEQLGGEIGAHNNTDKGATFWIRLPLGDNSSSTPVAESS